MTEGDQIRDFMDVKSASLALLKNCLKINDLKIPKVSISNLGTGKPKSLKAFAQELWDIHSKEGVLNIGSLSYRKNEIMRYVPNIETIHNFN